MSAANMTADAARITLDAVAFHVATMEQTMQTITGPTVERECGYCEGQGMHVNPDGNGQECELCGGTGTITMTVAPFVALGRAMEHIQQIRVSMRLRRTGKHKPKMGTPAYHVDAAEDAIGRLFQELAVMLPDEHDRTERGEA